MATVKVRDNGPLVIDGDDVQLIDNEGNAFSDFRRPLALSAALAALLRTSWGGQAALGVC